MKESSGRGVFPADYPSQSVDRIARQDDIYSRNRKNFLVAERFQKLYSPIASSADLSQVFFPVHRMIFASQSNIPQRKDLDDCLLQGLCFCLQLKVFLCFYRVILLQPLRFDNRI